MSTCDTHEMQARCGFHPGIVTGKFFETWDFYTEQLGFRTLDESLDHVVLVHPSGARLEVLQRETNDRHSELVSETDGRGFWLNLEVENVDSEYQRLCAAGVRLVHPPETQAAGRRVLTLRDPNGILICVFENTLETLRSCSVLSEAAAR